MQHSPRLTRFLAARRPYLADGGLETEMIFHEGIDLPGFAAYPLVDRDDGRAALTRYFESFLTHAAAAGSGFFLDTATWRANSAWMARLGHGDLEGVNARAVAFATGLRDRYETPLLPIVVNGAIGPSGDGYRIEDMLTPKQAFDIHAPQVFALARAGVDLVTAVTMTHPGEAIGVVLAAKSAGVPVAVSFTVETDGRLPNGQSLPEAIAETDAATGNASLYFMVNCAHPDHFADALAVGAAWLNRIGGIRANASRLSHAELDEATELDEGNPGEFGALYGLLAPRLPNLRLIGGCCGTDHRHVGAACDHIHGRLAA